MQQRNSARPGVYLAVLFHVKRQKQREFDCLDQSLDAGM